MDHAFNPKYNPDNNPIDCIIWSSKALRSAQMYTHDGIDLAEITAVDKTISLSFIKEDNTAWSIAVADNIGAEVRRKITEQNEAVKKARKRKT